MSLLFKTFYFKNKGAKSPELLLHCPLQSPSPRGEILKIHAESHRNLQRISYTLITQAALYVNTRYVDMLLFIHFFFYLLRMLVLHIFPQLSLKLTFTFRAGV